MLARSHESFGFSCGHRRGAEAHGTHMNHDHQCPACGATTITADQFFGRGRPVGFLPAGVRFWTLRARPVPFPSAADPRAYTACGLVWLRADPALLRQVISEAGRDETKRL